MPLMVGSTRHRLKHKTSSPAGTCTTPVSSFPFPSRPDVSKGGAKLTVVEAEGLGGIRGGVEKEGAEEQKTP